MTADDDWTVDDLTDDDARWALEQGRRAFESTGNPYYVWLEIDFCAKFNISFPDWIVAYLADCSRRMHSDKAKQTTDLREVLPWALGFPKKKPGPGTFLDPYRNSKRDHFGMEFVKLVLTGDDPVTARRDACNTIFDGKDSEADDKTYVRWLVEFFGLKKPPSNRRAVASGGL
jgi:hypothetical protein